MADTSDYHPCFEDVKVPLISGNQDDEGTILALGLLSLMTEDRLMDCMYIFL